MANSAKVRVFTYSEAKLQYTDITDYLDGSPNYEDNADKASMFEFTVVVARNDINYYDLVNPEVFAENAIIGFDLVAVGEHYVDKGPSVSSGFRRLKVKEVTTEYLHQYTRIRVTCMDTTVDMGRIKNTFLWKFKNVYELVLAMCRRYSIQLGLSEADKKMLERTKLPAQGIPQTDMPDRDFLRNVLKLTGKKMYISATADTLWLTRMSFHDIENAGDDWYSLYYLDVGDEDNNKLVSVEVSIERVDKKSGAATVAGNAVISEDGKMYVVVADQFGDIKGGKNGLAEFDPETGAYLPTDITIEEALKPPVKVREGDVQPEATKEQEQVKKVDKILLVQGWATKDDIIFNYMKSAEMQSDVRKLLVAARAMTAPSDRFMVPDPNLVQGTGFLAALNVYGRNPQVVAKADDGTASNSLSFIGKTVTSKLIAGAFMRRATEEDEIQHATYLRQEAVPADPKLYESSDDLADKSLSSNFRLESVNDVTTEYPFVISKTDTTAKPKNALTRITTQQVAELEERKRRFKELLDSTVGIVSPDTVKSYVVGNVDRLQYSSNLGEGRQITVNSGDQEVVSAAAMLNPNDPAAAQAILEEKEDDQAKKSLVMRAVIVFDPRYEPNTQVYLTGVVNKLHQGDWWCTEVIQEPGEFTTTLVCSRDYVQALAEAGVEEKPAYEDGGLYVIFDQFGNQVGNAVERGGVSAYKRYVLDRQMRLLDEEYSPVDD